jgi:hypothetical protein
MRKELEAKRLAAEVKIITSLIVLPSDTLLKCIAVVYFTQSSTSIGSSSTVTVCMTPSRSHSTASVLRALITTCLSHQHALYYTHMVLHTVVLTTWFAYWHTQLTHDPFKHAAVHDAGWQRSR